MFSEIFIRRLLQPCDSYKKVLLESKEFHINWKKQARAINKVNEFLEKNNNTNHLHLITS